MLWILFALGAALSWGLYGPALHRGQVELGNPMRALLCVGVAYFLIGVLVPVSLFLTRANLAGFTMKGSVGATLAGALGAAGAVCIIFAFRSGGLPTYVMPLVFAGAPLVNVLFSMWLHPPKTSPNPLLYLGFVLAASAAVWCFTSNRSRKRSSFVSPYELLVSSSLHEGDQNEKTCGSYCLQIGMRLIHCWPACRSHGPIAANWPQWRGPNRDGISKETGLLKQWPAEGPPLVWKATGAGRGYSSFSIANGRLYTMGLRGDREFIVAFDRRHRKRSLGHAARHGVSQRSWRRPARDADNRWRPDLCARRQRRSLGSRRKHRKSRLDHERAEGVWRVKHHVGHQRVAAGDGKQGAGECRWTRRFDRGAE